MRTLLLSALLTSLSWVAGQKIACNEVCSVISRNDPKAPVLTADELAQKIKDGECSVLPISPLGDPPVGSTLLLAWKTCKSVEIPKLPIRFPGAVCAMIYAYAYPVPEMPDPQPLNPGKSSELFFHFSIVYDPSAKASQFGNTESLCTDASGSLHSFSSVSQSRKKPEFLCSEFKNKEDCITVGKHRFDCRFDLGTGKCYFPTEDPGSDEFSKLSEEQQLQSLSATDFGDDNQGFSAEVGLDIDLSALGSITLFVSRIPNKEQIADGVKPFQVDAQPCALELATQPAATISDGKYLRKFGNENTEPNKIMQNQWNPGFRVDPNRMCQDPSKLDLEQNFLKQTASELKAFVKVPESVRKTSFRHEVAMSNLLTVMRSGWARTPAELIVTPDRVSTEILSPQEWTQQPTDQRAVCGFSLLGVVGAPVNARVRTGVACQPRSMVEFNSLDFEGQKTAISVDEQPSNIRFWSQKGRSCWVYFEYTERDTARKKIYDQLISSNGRSSSEQSAIDMSRWTHISFRITVNPRPNAGNSGGSTNSISSPDFCVVDYPISATVRWLSGVDRRSRAMIHSVSSLSANVYSVSDSISKQSKLQACHLDCSGFRFYGYSEQTGGCYCSDFDKPDFEGQLATVNCQSDSDVSAMHLTNIPTEIQRQMESEFLSQAKVFLGGRVPVTTVEFRRSDYYLGCVPRMDASLSFDISQELRAVSNLNTLSEWPAQQLGDFLGRSLCQSRCRGKSQFYGVSNEAKKCFCLDQSPKNTNGQLQCTEQCRNSNGFSKDFSGMTPDTMALKRCGGSSGATDVFVNPWRYFKPEARTPKLRQTVLPVYGGESNVWLKMPAAGANQDWQFGQALSLYFFTAEVRPHWNQVSVKLESFYSKLRNKADLRASWLEVGKRAFFVTSLAEVTLVPDSKDVGKWVCVTCNPQNKRDLSGAIRLGSLSPVYIVAPDEFHDFYFSFIDPDQTMHADIKDVSGKMHTDRRTMDSSLKSSDENTGFGVSTVEQLGIMEKTFRGKASADLSSFQLHTLLMRRCFKLGKKVTRFAKISWDIPLSMFGTNQTAAAQANNHSNWAATIGLDDLYVLPSFQESGPNGATQLEIRYRPFVGLKYTGLKLAGHTAEISAAIRFPRFSHRLPAEPCNAIFAEPPAAGANRDSCCGQDGPGFCQCKQLQCMRNCSGFGGIRTFNCDDTKVATTLPFCKCWLNQAGVIALAVTLVCLSLCCCLFCCLIAVRLWNQSAPIDDDDDYSDSDDFDYDDEYDYDTDGQSDEQW